MRQANWSRISCGSMSYITQGEGQMFDIGDIQVSSGSWMQLWRRRPLTLIEKDGNVLRNGEWIKAARFWKKSKSKHGDGEAAASANRVQSGLPLPQSQKHWTASQKRRIRPRRRRKSHSGDASHESLCGMSLALMTRYFPFSLANRFLLPMDDSRRMNASPQRRVDLWTWMRPCESWTLDTMAMIFGSPS